jgi:tRNA threonylcarbamoyladenosine biosynthesis protein TsaE
MKKDTREYTRDDIPTIAGHLKELLKKHPVITFTGSLGTGKTTLVQELLRQGGIKERVTSPTFTYVNRYDNDQGDTFYHFDLYRINSLNDFRGAGFDEYLYMPKSYTLIEWPEHIMPLLKERVCHVYLDYHDDPEKRVMRLECLE